MLEFDEATHVYRWRGNQVPNVTGIIEAAVDAYHGPEHVLEQAGRFGREVHKITVLDEKGILDEYEYDPQMDPWLESWRKYLRDFSYEDMPNPMVIDIKTGAKSPTWALQTAAYTQLLKENLSDLSRGLHHEIPLYSRKYGFAGTLDRAWVCGGRVGRRLVQVTDEKYDLYQFKDTLQSDVNVFVSMLNAWKWRKRNNLLKEG